jgi:hypothetical protein
MNQRRIAIMREEIDRLDDEMSDIVGLPRQPKPPRIPPTKVTLHQVHIHGDNLGVVNTGTVGKIEDNLSIINAQDAAVAERLRQVTEAVLGSNELSASQKQEAAELN